MKYDKNVMAQINKSNVINMIRKDGPINKSQIAKQLGLSIPTIMKIADDFECNHLIRVVGKGESNGGKRPELLEIIADAYYIIGVDIGRSRTTAIVMNLQGEIMTQKAIQTGKTNPINELIDKVIQLIDEVLIGSMAPINKILGMGVVTPGLIDIDNGHIIFSPDFGWENVDLITPIREHFSVPILLENSNRAVAMGERWFGVARESDYFICINLGHGIGSAIVENGEFYRGYSGSSGEFGHITLEKEGPLCECGNRGCLEALASGNAIARQAKEAILEDTKSIICKLAEDKIENIDAKAVFEAATLGDELANRIVDKAVEYIGIGLASYINLLDPDLIVLSGGIVNAGDIFIENVKEVIKTRRMKHAGRKVKIRVAKLGADAAAIGGASLILKKFIERGGTS